MNKNQTHLCFWITIAAMLIVFAAGLHLMNLWIFSLSFVLAAVNGIFLERILERNDNE